MNAVELSAVVSSRRLQPHQREGCRWRPIRHSALIYHTLTNSHNFTLTLTILLSLSLSFSQDGQLFTTGVVTYRHKAEYLPVTLSNLSSKVMDPSTGVKFTHYIYISILNSQKHFNIQSILKLITFNVSDNGSINKRVIHYNMSEFGTLL